MSMTELIIHPTTARNVGRFVHDPGHAVVLVAPAGSGKRSLISAMTAELLGIGHDTIRAYPYLKVIEPDKDKNSISIEAVRELQHFVSLKLPDKKARRIIHIFEAQGMGHEAQNSLLKLLEEPPTDTIFLLSSTSIQKLLPTIRSRTQQIIVHRPSRIDIADFYAAKGCDDKTIASGFFLSGGLPGLMTSLLADADHPLKETVMLARKLLQMKQFERLCLVDELSKKKPETAQLLFILQHMAAAAIEQASAKCATGNDAVMVAAKRSIGQWHKIRRAAYDAEQAYSVSSQAKLTLTHMMLSF